MSETSAAPGPVAIPDEVLRRHQTISIAEIRNVIEVVQDNRFTIGPPTPQCQEVPQWFLYGHGRTDENGQATLYLSQYLCDPAGVPRGTNRISTAGVPRFLATPISDQPRYLSYQLMVQEAPPPLGQVGYYDPPAADVTVHVYTWSADGNRAGRVSLSWHCAANVTQFSHI